MWQLISAGVSAMGAISVGAAAKKTSELTAFNIETESDLSRTQALQQSRIRNNEFKEALATADAFFMGVAGRDISDRSIEAYKRKELETTGDDISDIEMMSRLNQLKFKTEAFAERRRGREFYRASLFRAATTVASGYADYQDTLTKGAST